MNIIWTCPVASTSFLREPTLEILPKREYVIRFTYEDGDDSKGIDLHFRKVVAFRCHHLPALSAEMIKRSYDKLVDRGETEWLKETQNRVISSKVQRGPVSHLEITFDDGPCYEFLCESYEVSIPG